jgi:hypothetical protein
MFIKSRQTIFSPCRQYRYTLWRTWNMYRPGYLQVIGLNPSTADETQDDPTIRRCISFAQLWGYGALCVTNLFAYRATNPRALYEVSDPVGHDNDRYIANIACDASLILAAWGTHGAYQGRWQHVAGIVAGPKLMCLGTTKHGFPRHPLYVAQTQAPVPFSLPTDAIQARDRQRGNFLRA